MEKIADSNSKALIEALKEVIRDFNAKINEHFGENFKHLNSAVEKILHWQETYRQQMSDMIEQQKVTTSSMSEATARYADMVTHSEHFSSVANNLSSLIKTLDSQREQISLSISALGQLLKSAGDNLPRIEAHVIAMTNQVEAGVRASNEKINSTILAMTESLKSSQADMKKTILEGAEQTNKDATNRIKQIGDQLQANILSMTQALRTSHIEMKKLLAEATEAAHRDVNTHALPRCGLTLSVPH
jgi:DNA anti-recombination protein RmuC